MKPEKYKGKDGNFYSTSEELSAANEVWERRNLQYKGRDGNLYPAEELGAANEVWERRNLQYKGKDGNFYSTSEELRAANEAMDENKAI